MIIRAVGAGYAAVTVIAQAADGTTSTGTILDFAQWGLAGLIILGFIVGWIVPKPTHDAVRSDLARREAQLESLTATYQQTVIPVLTEVNSKLVEMAANPPHQATRGR